MPTIKLEPLHAAPYDKTHAIIDVQNGSLTFPPPHGDVHLLCAHCDYPVVQHLWSKDTIQAPPPGIAIRCSQCRKYSLLRNSPFEGAGSDTPQH